eukprot:342586_1
MATKKESTLDLLVIGYIRQLQYDYTIIPIDIIQIVKLFQTPTRFSQLFHKAVMTENIMDKDDKYYTYIVLHSLSTMLKDVTLTKYYQEILHIIVSLFTHNSALSGHVLSHAFYIILPA